MWSRYGLGLSPVFTIIADPSLVTTEARKLTRWERFRAWAEDLADEAEIYYHYPRVQRSETKPSDKIIVAGGLMFCHPAVAQRLRKRFADAPDA